MNQDNMENITGRKRKRDDEKNNTPSTKNSDVPDVEETVEPSTLFVDERVSLLMSFIGCISGIARLIFDFSIDDIEKKLQEYEDSCIVFDSLGGRGDDFHFKKPDEPVRLAESKMSDLYEELLYIINFEFLHESDTRKYRGYLQFRLNSIGETNPEYLPTIELLGSFILHNQEEDEMFSDGYAMGCECEDCSSTKWSDFSRNGGKCNCVSHPPIGKYRCHYCDDTILPTCDDHLYGGDPHHEGCGCNSRVEKIILPVDNRLNYGMFF